MSILVDCRWGNWGSWSECTQECERYSVRKMERKRQQDGAQCTGNNNRTSSCNEERCPGYLLTK